MMYHDPDVYELERELVFATSWVAVARHDELRVPGAFVTAEVAGEPVVVVRGRDGVLRAFPNVCRHRGMTIVDGAGTASALQCPYHLWTWSLDGRLVGAPQMDRAHGFDPALECLGELGIAEWQGFVLVCLDPEVTAFEDTVPGLTARCAAHALSSLVRGPSAHYDSSANWKVLVENFIESYHHAGVHPDSLQTTYPGQRSYVESEHGEPWSWLDHVSVVDGFEPFAVPIAFPTLGFVIVRGLGGYWFDMRPIDATHTSLDIVTLVPPDAPAEVGELLLESAVHVNDEDVAINERTQRGLASRFAAPGRVSHLEQACWEFRRWLVDQLEPGLG
jgi:phenylpropionate dioxygenase-like ring-hydroxylating dioxygenase large terminal subunit